jgi:hypothetical protein
VEVGSAITRAESIFARKVSGKTLGRSLPGISRQEPGDGRRGTSSSCWMLFRLIQLGVGGTVAPSSRDRVSPSLAPLGVLRHFETAIYVARGTLVHGIASNAEPVAFVGLCSDRIPTVPYSV